MLCERTMFIPVFVVLALLGTIVSGQSEGPDTSLVKARWGVSDGLAHVGRLYRMHVPSDAFSGKVLSYTVTTAEGNPLPQWLAFDAKDNVLVGIPTRKDVGDITLKVVAKGENSEDYVLFTITIKDVPSLTSGSPLKFRKSSGPEIVRCKRDEAETVATIVIDVDMENRPITDIVTLLDTFLSHMNLQHEMVKLTPVGNSPLQDSSALVSGPGDCTQQKTSGMFLSWPVGCGQVKEGHFEVLQRLDDDSRSGMMAKVIGHPIIGWHVSNSHLQPLKRKRRQAMVTATLSMTPVMSTKTDEKTESAGEKMTREVPEHSSPVIQPTSTQPVMTKTAGPEVMPTHKEKDSTMVKPSETPVVTPPATKTPPIEPTATVKETEKTVELTTPSGGGDSCVRGKAPAVNKVFKRLDFNVGDVIDFPIPVDTFEDCETGGTRGLSLMLFLEKTEKIAPDFFIQFDEKKQRVIGLPMSDNAGRYKMNLVGQKDSNGLVASIPFNLVIKGTKNKKKINHELSVAIDMDYDKFMASVEDKMMLSNKVASIYGDSDASNLVITTLARGSVRYGWANKSLSSNDCPVGDLKGMVGKLVNEDGTLTEEAIEKMKPYYLMGAVSAPAGACENNPDFPAVVSELREKPTDPTGEGDGKTTPESKTDAPVKPTVKSPDGKTTTEPVGESKKDGDDDDVWITTVVPAVVIVVILIIALLIACILYRKKRKGKMNVEEQNTFVNKGAPVIFPDELEDKPNDVNKPLLVEGSSAPPPEYHRGTSESPDPEMTNHRNGPNHDDRITEMPERPYEPPPPVATSSNNKQPRPTQQPMSQHPQILP